MFNSNSFDIAALAVSDTSILHLKGPDDELLYSDAEKTQPVTVELYGPGSDQYAAVEKRISDRNIERMLKGKKKAQISAESAKADRLEKLIGCTKAFSPNFRYTPAGDAQGDAFHRAVYSDPRIGFIADQVLAHIGDWANFTPSSATS